MPNGQIWKLKSNLTCKHDDPFFAPSIKSTPTTIITASLFKFRLFKFIRVTVFMCGVFGFFCLFKYNFGRGEDQKTSDIFKLQSNIPGEKRRSTTTENLRHLMASHLTTCALDASERFDKQALLQIHDSTRQRLATSVQTCFSSPDPIGSSAAPSSVSLETLETISLTELQIGQVHHGRVLYGILCAEAFSTSAIMTVLEDNNGLAVRLAIHNAVHMQTNVEMLYPRGAKVAIMEPYFKREDDGTLAIRVDNPANVEMLGCSDAAAEHYTKFIDADSKREDTRLQAKEFDKYDISDYLLGRGSSTTEVADFIGPVEICMNKDGHGRGLYATQEIKTGELLLVSNAVAIAYEDDNSAGDNSPHRPNSTKENLVAEVVSAAMKSQRLLQQLYSLHDYSETDSLDVPAIDLFKTEGQMSPSEAAGKEKLQVDDNRISNIISRNSFGAAEQTFAAESKLYETRLVQRCRNFAGLWLLPSFINHSCLPNTSRLEVGRAMFIHASKPIKRGEEITISYFDTLVPLPQREAMCESWGFKCNCKRCILEFCLNEALEPISGRFEELYEKALEETNAARSPEGFDADLPTCAEFAKLFVEAEKIIRSSVLLKTEEERNWIRASFVSAYLAGTQSNEFLPTMLMDCVPSRVQVMEAIKNTVPADIRTLVLVAQQLKEAALLIGDESQVCITPQAREVCMGVFGRWHREDVLNVLVLRNSNTHLF